MIIDVAQLLLLYLFVLIGAWALLRLTGWPPRW